MIHVPTQFLHPRLGIKSYARSWAGVVWPPSPRDRVHHQ